MLRFREKVEAFLDTRHAATATKFLIGVILKLVMSAKLTLRANDYGDSVYVGVQDFLAKNRDVLVKQVRNLDFLNFLLSMKLAYSLGIEFALKHSATASSLVYLFLVLCFFTQVKFVIERIC